MEWLVFLAAITWLTGTAAVWFRLTALGRRLRKLEDDGRRLEEDRPAPAPPEPAPPPLFSHPEAAEPVRRLAASGASLNFSRRVQILRLYRRGESPSHIAAALGLPAAEVELIVKLHGASLQPAGRE